MYKNVQELVEKLKQESKINFKIKVVANSKVNLIDFCDDFIKIKIMAPAIDGKANKAIVEFLAKTLCVSKNKVSIVNGEKSSLKLIRVEL